MRIRSIAVLLGAAALCGFVALNWTVFSTPAPLQVGVATVQAPLGLVMLGLIGVIAGLFVANLVVLQAGVIMEARRYAKELKSQRELADQAESSRFTDLRELLVNEVGTLRAQAATHSDECAQRLKDVEHRLAERLDETARTLSAYVGEVDDKLDRLDRPAA